MAKKKKQKKDRLEGATRAFQVVSGLFFTLFLLSLIVCISASKKGILKVVREYVNSVEITDEYFDNYINAGFSEEMCYDLLESKNVRNTVSYVMYDRVVALLHNTSSYEYSMEYCENIIEEEIISIAEVNNLTLSDDNIDILTTYTIDICGISAMFIYDTPVVYRTSVFDATNEDIGAYSELFELLATLSSTFFPICFGIMFLVCIFILFVVCEREAMNRLFLLVCDTMTLPSLVCLAISVAKLFGDKTDNILSNYVFRITFITSLVGVMLGVTGAIITRKIFKK